MDLRAHSAQVQVQTSGRPNSSGSGRGTICADALIESGFSGPLSDGHQHQSSRWPSPWSSPTSGTDGGERDFGPDERQWGRRTRYVFPANDVQRRGHQRHPDLHGDESRRHAAAPVAVLRHQNPHLLGHAADGRRGDGAREGDRQRRRRRVGQRRIRHHGEHGGEQPCDGRADDHRDAARSGRR